MNFKTSIQVFGAAVAAAGLSRRLRALRERIRSSASREWRRKVKILGEEEPDPVEVRAGHRQGQAPALDRLCGGERPDITAAEGKLQDKIEKACEGENPVTIGYPATCPDLENQGCDSISLATAAGMGQCLVCLDEFAVDEIYSVIGGPFLDPAGDEVVAACQGTIAKESQKFLKAKTKGAPEMLGCAPEGQALRRLPEPERGPEEPGGQGGGKIAKAESKFREKVCKSCGGDDQVCGSSGTGSSGDVLPSVFGFPASCPSVTVPGGQECGLPIDGLQDALDCMVCLSEFKADCTTDAGVSQLQGYPQVCDPVVVPPCSSASISVDVAFTPPADDVAGVTGVRQLSGPEAPARAGHPDQPAGRHLPVR